MLQRGKILATSRSIRLSPRSHYPVSCKTWAVLLAPSNKNISCLRWCSSPATGKGVARNAFAELWKEREHTDSTVRPEQDPEKTTLTRRERAVFEQLFKSLDSHKGHEAARGQTELDDEFEEGTDDPLSDVPLDEIFAEAISADGDRVSSPRVPSKAVSPGFRAPPDNARPPIDVTWGNEELPTYDEEGPAPKPRQKFKRVQLNQVQPAAAGDSIAKPTYETDVEEARRQYLSRTKGLISVAKSDTRIWNILDKEVFSRMKELTSCLAAEEQAHDEPTNHTQLGGPKENGTSKHKAKIPAAPNTPTSPHPLSILQTTYGPILMFAQHELRIRFPRSPFTVAILPAVRALGPISYVLGASTQLYNELLYVRWMYHSDAHACADLLYEMLDRSVPPDRRTFAVFRYADWQRRRDTLTEDIENAERAGPRTKLSVSNERPEVSPVSTAWWRLQGVKSGWVRWRAAHEEAVKEYNEMRRERLGANATGEGSEDGAIAESSEENMTGEPEVELLGSGAHDEVGAEVEMAAAALKPL